MATLWHRCYKSFCLSDGGSRVLGSLIFHHYRPQRSWGKVIFSQASVILSTEGGGMHGLGGHAWLGGRACVAGVCA